MLKRKYLCLAGIFCLLFAFMGNVHSQSVVTCQGDSYNNGQIQVDFTLGEPIINTLFDDQVIVTQGFNQPDVKYVGLTDKCGLASVHVYPNPVYDKMNIYCVLRVDASYFYSITDLTGKEVLNGMIEGEATSVSLVSCARGMFFLKVVDIDENELGKVKIIKL